MKRMLALLMALMLLCGTALAEAPRLSDRLFACTKQALLCLASGEYERLVTGLPFADVAPSAKEWKRFAGNFSDLKKVQTDYAVAYWRGSAWCIAVPVHTPRDGSVEALVLTSGDGASFNGYRYATWSQVENGYNASDRVLWNVEYVGGTPTVVAD